MAKAEKIHVEALARRTPLGTVVRPRQQLRYAMILVCGGILAQSLVIGLVAFLMSRTIAEVTAAHGLDPDVGAVITHSITTMLVTVMIVATAVAAIAILIGIKLSHRIYGPLVPFTRHIEALKAGNYKSRIYLRKNDDLIEIQDALNGLAEVLEDKHPAKRA